eukprot:6338801-Prymnesium_polylepis.1
MKRRPREMHNLAWRLDISSNARCTSLLVPRPMDASGRLSESSTLPSFAPPASSKSTRQLTPDAHAPFSSSFSCSTAWGAQPAVRLASARSLSISLNDTAGRTSGRQLPGCGTWLPLPISTGIGGGIGGINAG